MLYSGSDDVKQSKIYMQLADIRLYDILAWNSAESNEKRLEVGAPDVFPRTRSRILEKSG